MTIELLKTIFLKSHEAGQSIVICPTNYECSVNANVILDRKIVNTDCTQTPRPSFSLNGERG